MYKLFIFYFILFKLYFILFYFLFGEKLGEGSLENLPIDRKRLKFSFDIP